jgi:alpha-amylase
MLGHDDGGSEDFSRRDVLKGIGAAGAATAVGASATGSASAAIGDSAVYQYYHTDWSTVKSDMSAIADQGYDAVQVPPAQESYLDRSDQDWNYHPPMGYQPVDHRNFNSVFGTEDQYQYLIWEAHNHGLDVIADAVVNHMAAAPYDTFPWFGYDDFHHNGAIDYSDPWSVENGDLVGLKDLKQESSYVRGQLKRYIEKYANLGVDGIRWDAAKHVPEWFFRDYANVWANNLGLYTVGEVLQGDTGYCQGYADTGMSVTDYPLYYAMKDAFKPYGDMRAVEGAGLVNQDPYHAMTFVSNHDSGPPELEKLAYAYILTYEGYPRVYNNRIGIHDGDIRNLLWIRNNLASGQTFTRHVDQNLYIYERYNNLLVGLNKSGSWRGKWVPTSWRDQALNEYTGHAENEYVNGDGWVYISIPPESWVCYAV